MQSNDGCSNDATVDQFIEGERVNSNDMILMIGAHHCRTVLCDPNDFLLQREKDTPWSSSITYINGRI